MRGTKYSEEQIIGILKAAEKGFATSELCRQHSARPAANARSAILIQTDGGATAPGR